VLGLQTCTTTHLVIVKNEDKKYVHDWWLMPVILTTWEAEIRRIGHSRPAWANSLRDPISKITRAKRMGVVAQTVECLLCKHEALSSNSNPTKKNMCMTFPVVGGIGDKWLDLCICLCLSDHNFFLYQLFLSSSSSSGLGFETTTTKIICLASLLTI
jgi:hypothetical protein